MLQDLKVLKDHKERLLALREIMVLKEILVQSHLKGLKVLKD